MRWIARFFLIIALAFLALDLLDSGEPAPAAGGAADAAAGGGTTSGERPAAGTTTGGTTTGETTTGDTATGGETGAAETAAGEKPAGGGAPAAGAATAPAKTAARSRVELHSLGERWYQYHASSYQQVSPAVSRHVSAWLDDNIVQPLMLQPAFLIFFFLSLLFSFFSWLIGRARADHEDY